MKIDLVSTASFLAQTRFFSSLSLNELMILAANTSVYLCPGGQVIFRKDDPGDVLYIIRSGAVRILLPIETGREATLAILHFGELFGELSLLDGRPRSATAVALEPLEAITIKQADFLTFLRRQPEAAIRIMGVLAARLRRTDELLGETLFLDLPSRLAKKLLELAEADGVETDQGIEVPLKLTLKDLASLVGTSQSTLSRYLKIFGARGILRLSRQKMVILQPESLRSLAE